MFIEDRHPVDILKPKNKRNWKKLEKAVPKPCENTPRSSSLVPGPSNQPQTDAEDVPLLSISPTPSELEVEGGLDYATDDPVVDRVCREGGVRLLSFLMAQAVSPTANAATDPKTWSYHDMTRLPIAEQKEWQDACLRELEALKRRNVFELVQHPSGRKVIKNRWVFDVKSDGRKCARLVAKGFSQVEGLDYDQVFSPVV